MIINIFFCQVVLYHEEGHIADHLGGRSYLDDIAEHHVDLMVHFAYFQPSVAKAYCGSLLTEVGILSTWHFVFVHGGVWIGHLRIHTGIVWTDCLPVAVNLFQFLHVEVHLARVILECIVHSGDRRLAGAAGQRRCRQVDNVYAGINSVGIGVEHGTAAGMAVQVNREVYCILQCGYQCSSGFRLEQTSHILDGNDVSPCPFHILSQVCIVLE